MDGHYATGYLGAGGRMHTWHGQDMGRALVLRSWLTPRSFVSSRMYQVAATIHGYHYTGRCGGEGMLWRGRIMACCKHHTGPHRMGTR